jgi:hypothetical protein
MEEVKIFDLNELFYPMGKKGDVMCKIDCKNERPKFCYDKDCTVVFSTYNEADFDKGFGFFCLGKLKEPKIFKEKSIEHVNGLSYCCYTPLKGMIRFFVNTDDLWKEATNMLAALNRLIEIKCPQCNSKIYKVPYHVCFECQAKRTSTAGR